MKKVFKNYKSSIILLSGIIIGAIFGLIFKEKAAVVSPLGDLFLNLLLITIVPLIFLSISSSIAKMKQPKRIGKVLTSVIVVFIVTSIVAVLVGIVATKYVPLIKKGDTAKILETMDTEAETEEIELNLLERTVDTISVSDFKDLLTKGNIIALIVASIIFGSAVNMAGSKGTKTAELLDSLMEVIIKFVGIIMYYAPIGLGCYFAAQVGTLGSMVIEGYLRTFIYYLVIAFAFYFVVYTLYAYLAAGRKGIKAFWKNALPPTLTALGTCSSAASIPANMEFAKKIGVPDDIADTTISLGTSFHKDGSNIGSVFKIMFLVALFGTNIASFSGTMQILGVALLATLLITAVPIGGGTISEMLIITMLGYPSGALLMLTVIATIIDAPATLLNVVGDSASSMLVARMVEGKNWLK